MLRNHLLLTPISALPCFSSRSSMCELAGGTFSGRTRAPAPSPSLWSNRRGRQLMGDLRERGDGRVSLSHQRLIRTGKAAAARTARTGSLSASSPDTGSGSRRGRILWYKHRFYQVNKPRSLLIMSTEDGALPPGSDVCAWLSRGGAVDRQLENGCAELRL